MVSADHLRKRLDKRVACCVRAAPLSRESGALRNRARVLALLSIRCAAGSGDFGTRRRCVALLPRIQFLGGMGTVVSRKCAGSPDRHTGNFSTGFWALRGMRQLVSPHGGLKERS